MIQKLKRNSGFSLIELIIAMAVLAFLMLAVSSFMSSSVIQNKKAKVDVRLQAQAQETYSLITDSIMQASDIAIIGYVADDDSLINLEKPDSDGEDTSAVLTKKYFVRDQAAADELMAEYGAIDTSNIVFFKDADVNQKVYVTLMQVKSAVPLDMSYVPGGNTETTADQKIRNDITNDLTDVTCTVEGTEKIYSINDTLISTIYFEENNMYYGRKYTYMVGPNALDPDLDDPLDITDAESKITHLYNKYFSYLKGKSGALDADVSGCVATINGKDGSIGIDLYYNQSSMTYTTIGRVNPRNSYVLVPKK